MSGLILQTDQTIKSFKKVRGFSFVWQTPPIDQHLSTTIESTHFKSGIESEFDWNLIISPEAHNRQSRDFISVHLALPDSSFVYRSAGCYVVLCFVGKDGKEYMTRDTFFKLRLYQSERHFDFSKSDIFSDKLPLLVEGKLTIKVVIYHFPEYYPIKVNEYSRGPLGSEKFSDIKFTFQDGTMIYAHKIILAAGSKVFSAMFEHDKGNEVKIVDISKNIMMELFRFIYYGRVEGMKAVAQELFVAADKYEIMELRMKCEEALISNLRKSNAMETLVFSEIYNNKILEVATKKYILTHIKEIIKMNNFDEIVSSGRPCIVDLFKSLAVRD